MARTLDSRAMEPTGSVADHSSLEAEGDADLSPFKRCLLKLAKPINNIFVRIYGGMMLSLVLVSAFAYFTYHSVNDYRSEAYHEVMSKGSMQLIANGVSRHQGADRDRWLVMISRLLGLTLHTVAAEELPLSVKGAIKLDKSQVMVKSGSDDAADVYVPIPGEPDVYLHVKLYEFTEQQARGTAHLVLDDLSRFDRSQWDGRLAQLQDYFTFPIGRKSPHEVPLDASQQARLKRGEVVVALGEASAKSSTIRIIAPMPGSEDYLVLGPLNLFDWYPIQVMLAGGFAALVLMAFATVLLVRPLQRRLKRMEIAVTQLRRGDLDARVEVDGNDALDQLARTLNDMAIHIKRLIQSQREMTHAVSHELRTPVARIRFGLQMIEDAVSEDQRNKQIKDIDSDIEELDKLIDEILTYATLEEGTPALNFKRVDVEAILQQVKRETEALGKPVSVEHVPIKLPENDRLAECEERYLHRVVQNLVGNATRYADSVVRISSAVEGSMYRIEVEDDGPGIPQEQWKKVFVPFARLDDSRTRASGGYGLGLSIVQRIAYWHGGLVSVNRSPDLGGARFIFIWPRTQAVREKLEERQMVKKR